MPGRSGRCSSATSAVSVRRGSITIIFRSGSFLISLTALRALLKPCASQGLQPSTTSRSQCSMSSAVWQIWSPNSLPLTQKSPVFSCESALK